MKLVAVRPLTIILGLGILFCAGSFAQVSSTWTGAAGDGNYNNAANWSNGVPDGPYSSGPFKAIVPGGTATNPTITGGNSDTLTSLSIGTANSNGSLTVGDNATLYFDTGNVGSTIANNGTFSLASGGNISQVVLEGGKTVSLSGTGIFSWSDNGNNRVIANTAGMTFANSSTVQGSGSFSNASQNYTLTNSGTIAAYSASKSNSLLIDPGAGVTNTGTLEAGIDATHTGTLELYGDTFTNTTGTILANSGSTVQLVDSTISGGTFKTLGTGVIQTVGGNSATLTGSSVALTSGSVFNVVDNTTLYVTGGTTLNNSGTLTLASGGNISQMVLTGSGTVTLGGTGIYTTSDNGNNRIVANSNGLTLANTGVFQGSGSISNASNNFALTNSGTITAYSAGGGNSLVIDPGAGVTNANLLQAGIDSTHTGTLVLYSDTFTNTGATILANTGSVVDLLDSTISGGTLKTLGTGVIQTEGGNSATLNGTVALASGSALNVVDNTTLYLTGGSTLNNSGTVTLASGGNTTQVALTGSGTVNVGGSGAITLDDNGANRIIAVSPNMTLNNTGVIQGSGALNNASNSYTLTNSGTITASSSHGNSLVIDPGAGVSNTGTLQAANGGTLVLYGDTFTNTGNGKILAETGGVVDLLDNTVVGGTLNTAGTGVIQTQGGNSAYLTNVTLSSGSVLHVVDNTTLYLTKGSTFTDNGAVSLLSGGNTTQIVLTGGGTDTLAGTGTITLNDSNANRIVADTGGTVLVNNLPISGSGSLSSAAQNYTLDNKSTITALSAGGNSLTVNPGAGVTNTGTLQAGNGTANGTLVLANDTFTNTGGKIVANTGSTVQLLNNTVVGGTLTTAGSGSIQTVGGNSATLSGTTISTGSTVSVVDNTSLYIPATTPTTTFTNDGTLALQSGGNTTQIVLTGAGSATLAGTGIINLNDSGANRIVSVTGGNTLVNNTTIQGAGSISNAAQNFTVQNNGTITALGSNALVVNPGAGVTNNKTLQAGNATGTGTLVLQNDTFTNTKGTILANAGSTVELLNSTISGGILKSAAKTKTLGAGLIQTVGGNSARLAGSTQIYTGSVLNVVDNTSLYLGSGTILTNNGTLGLQSGGNTTQIVLDGVASKPVTLSGTGTLLMDNQGANRIVANTGGMTFVNNSNISGAGQFSNAAQNYNVTNNGTITANGSAGLTAFNGGNFTNNGTTAATAGSTFQIQTNTNLTNFSGTTLTGGTYNAAGTIEFGASGTTIMTDAANINLTSASAALINNAGASLLTPLNTIAANGSFGVSGGANFTTAGDFTVNGTLNVGTGSSFVVPSGFALTNLTGTKLVGGTYNIGGTVQFGNSGTNITENDANIALTSASAKIINLANGNILAPLATNDAGASFTVTGGANFTTAGNFTNNGTLAVGTGSKFAVVPGSSLTNFSGNTLTGGTYNVTGTLQFGPAGTSLVNNAANLILNGTTAKILDSSNGNILAGFANNTAAGSFSLQNKGVFTAAAGTFTNNGQFTVGVGSTFTVSNGGFTQAGGTAQIDGTLTSTASTPSISVAGGLLDGTGLLKGNVTDSATIMPGDSSTTTAALKVTGPYTQTAAGALDISIAGKTAGTQYDELNVTGTAAVNGTLNISLVKGFVPTLGTTFKVVNATSLSGTFSTVNGTSINGSEHFSVTYGSNDVLLTVVSGASAVASTKSSVLSRLHPPSFATFAAAQPSSIAHVITVPTHASAFVGVPAHAMAQHPSVAGRLHDRNKMGFGINVLSLFTSNPKAMLKGFADANSPNAVFSYGGAR